MDKALVAHLVNMLAQALLPTLLPFVVACGAGSLLLHLFDDLRSATAPHTRVPLVMTALSSAVGLWAVPLLSLLVRWPLHEGPVVLVMTLASFRWSLAVAVLWCVPGGRAGLMRALLLGVLLSVSGPVAVLLLAGVTSFSATAWEDAGLLGIVMVLSAMACAAALQLALSARSGATGAAVRRPGVSLFVSVLFDVALTADVVHTVSLAGSFSTLSDMPGNAPVGLRLLLVVGAAATVLAALLLGYRDRATDNTAAAVATREIRLRRETVQALNNLEQSYRRREVKLVARHQLLLDGADVGLWEFDLVTRAVQFSARFAAMLGHTFKGIGPNTSEYLRLVYPDDLPMVLNRIQAHVDGTTPAYVAGFRMRHKDGSYRQIAAHGVAVCDAGGSAVRMTGSHIEVTAKAASAGVAGSAASIVTKAPETLRRHGLWESWMPADHPAAEAVAPQTESTSPPGPTTMSTGDTLPSINPGALR